MRKIKRSRTQKKHGRNIKKTRHKRGGGIPLGPIVTIGVLALAAIVGPIAATYMDETNIDHAKKEANDIKREMTMRDKDDRMYFGEKNPNPGDRSGREHDNENQNRFSDESGDIGVELTDDAVTSEIRERARKQSEKMLLESPYWRVDGGVLRTI